MRDSRVYHTLIHQRDIYALFECSYEEDHTNGFIIPIVVGREKRAKKKVSFFPLLDEWQKACLGTRVWVYLYNSIKEKKKISRNTLDLCETLNKQRWARVVYAHMRIREFFFSWRAVFFTFIIRSIYIEIYSPRVGFCCLAKKYREINQEPLNVWNIRPIFVKYTNEWLYRT